LRNHILWGGLSLSAAAVLVVVVWRLEALLWLGVPLVALVLLGIYDLFQHKHTLLRNFPVAGHLRWLFEKIRPEIRQYFVESDLSGRPVNRRDRSLIYARAKQQLDTQPFGTESDVRRVGYEWANHALNPTHSELDAVSARVRVGPECKQPYEASILNISAMSFGALSSRAVLALNHGARKGGFAHNTGEGGISKYHLEPGGDLIWQLGTGYFGCRTRDGQFDRRQFQDKVAHPAVKLVELKLSQGAKPGHGGVLPACKNSREIAGMRGVEPHQTVISPPNHSAFSGNGGLLEFIEKLRETSDGKPVGIKLCVGKDKELRALVATMAREKMYPDFVTVDGAEGGTGAAPVEHSNSIGTPLLEGLSLLDNLLRGYGLRERIRVIASGRIFTAFDLIRVMGLGADLVNSARGMMFALGCIQALECNKNTCPTGVTTNNPRLVRGLVVKDKAERVYQYHRDTVNTACELLGTLGYKRFEQLKREDFQRRISATKVATLEDIYPTVEAGAYLKEDFELGARAPLSSDGLPTRGC